MSVLRQEILRRNCGLDLGMRHRGQGKLSELRSLFKELSTKECVKKFMAVVTDIAEKSRAIIQTQKLLTVLPRNKWFDYECKEMKKKVRIKASGMDGLTAELFKCLNEESLVYNKIF